MATEVYYRYFDNLSNNTDCDELVQFSKDYINYQVGERIINICGRSMSGKSLLIKLLNQYTKCTYLKPSQLNRHILHHFYGRYIIVDGIDNLTFKRYANIIREFIGKNYNYNGYSWDADFIFVFISNERLTDITLSRQIKYVPLENKFNNSNIEFILTEDPEAFKDYIMF